MGVTQAAISKRLKAAGYIQKQGDWIPHKLKPRDVERRVLHVRNAAGTPQKEVCKTRPTSQINGKAEYPWREGNALYLVGSEGYAVL